VLRQQQRLLRLIQRRRRQQLRAYKNALRLLRKAQRQLLGTAPAVDLSPGAVMGLPGYSGGIGSPVTLDIYRTFDVNNPFGVTVNSPDVPGVNGFIRHHMKAGRFGFQSRNLFWTHLLQFPLETDIRSAYSSQLNPAFDPTKADTVIIQDYPDTGKTTAFMVVMVQRIGRGTPQDMLRAYLDRCGPDKPFCCRQVPDALHVTFTNIGGLCACLAGSFDINYDAGQGKWVGTTNVCSSTLTFKFWCSHPENGIHGFSYSFQCTGGPESVFGPGGQFIQCKPFLYSDSGFAPISNCCSGSIVFTISQ
jgi:hypothetical protein